MTPTEQDKELREAIEDLISQVGNYWFCVAKETSDSRTLSEGEAMKQIMQLITADRKRVASEAKKNGFYMAAGLFGADISRVEELWDKCEQELEKL